MGIEDLNLDISEHAERVLVVTERDELFAELSALLHQRACLTLRARGIMAAAQLAASEVIDMVMLDCEHTDPQGEIAKARANPHLRRAALAALSTRFTLGETGPDDPLGPGVLLLPLPIRAGDVLVKISTKLRLRKMDRREAEFATGLSARNAQLRDLTTRFKRELREAQAIQQSLLPQTLPAHPRMLCHASYLPLEAVGGDIYDLWEIAPGRFGFFVGDVTGHGLPAAFIGAMTKMALAYAKQDRPDEMVAEMNLGLAAHMPEGRFVTAIAAIYDADTSELQLARGGHPQALLHRAADSAVEEIAPKGLPLGITTEVPYELYTTKLEAGDKLLLFTDGLVEGADMNGSLFGIGGVRRHLIEAASADVTSTIAHILERYKDFTSGRVVKDDITIVGLECRASIGG